LLETFLVKQYEGAHPRFLFDGAKIGSIQNFNTQVTGNLRETFLFLPMPTSVCRIVLLTGAKLRT
jgi:hypothetical protein